MEAAAKSNIKKVTSSSLFLFTSSVAPRDDLSTELLFDERFKIIIV